MENQGIAYVWFFDEAGLDVDGRPRAWVETMRDERTARAVCNTMMAGGMSFPVVEDGESAEKAHSLAGGAFVTILGTYSDSEDIQDNMRSAFRAVGDFIGFDGVGCPDGYECDGVCDLYRVCPYAAAAAKKED